MPATSLERLNAEIGILDAMDWMARANRFRLDFRFGTEQNWQDGLTDLTEDLEPHLTGRFMVVLGNESRLTDATAEYVIYFDDEADREAISARWTPVV
jgi:hypothetical protein